MKFCVVHFECGDPVFVDAQNHLEALTNANPLVRYAFESDGSGTFESPEYDSMTTFLKRKQLKFSRNVIAENCIDQYNAAELSEDFPPRDGEVWMTEIKRSDDTFVVYPIINKEK